MKMQHLKKFLNDAENEKNNLNKFLKTSEDNRQQLEVHIQRLINALKDKEEELISLKKHWFFRTQRILFRMFKSKKYKQ